ncbi:Threonine synthase [Poriferisphaera corsica]|uniref:Threonine synthase n=1 Tax=Poriferisphaera corsica TaxID=2528020 RepID=A0A517YRS0_9BACT|nr:threonine synthase [Poriferisphaera corsica]QDU32924.1 Threonine synthase [Poriferisphaera corsica]
MRYISTRGSAELVDFEGALMTGLARDGGLYVPETWPTFSADDLRAMRGLSYPEIAFRVMKPFVSPCIPDEDFKKIIDESYATFVDHSVAPLSQLGPNLWLMELYHGPTLAFKDVAMQVLGRLYDYVLNKRDKRITVVGATSGDTGSAAIEAIRGRSRASIFIMHPNNRTSEVQRRQMTTVDANNVHNIAIEGTFDDCQNLLKAMFNDHDFRDEIKISGVNSINWARIMPQMVYYVAAAVSLGAPDRTINFTVPTGNFGDIFAGYAAKQIGLPIDKLVIASNLNDILTRVMNTGAHTLGEVHPTMSPSMDIQISSNFERLLFDLYDRDGKAIADLMNQLTETGTFTLGQAQREKALKLFTAQRVDEEQTLKTIEKVYQQSEKLIDPHTAVGVEAAWREQDAATDKSTPMVTLSTAHPAKFPDNVEKATGTRPPLPQHMLDLYDREERFTVLPNDLETVTTHIRKTLAAESQTV